MGDEYLNGQAIWIVSEYSGKKEAYPINPFHLIYLSNNIFEVFMVKEVWYESCLNSLRMTNARMVKLYDLYPNNREKRRYTSN